MGGHRWWKKNKQGFTRIFHCKIMWGSDATHGKKRGKTAPISNGYSRKYGSIFHAFSLCFCKSATKAYWHQASPLYNSFFLFPFWQTFLLPHSKKESRLRVREFETKDKDDIEDFLLSKWLVFIQLISLSLNKLFISLLIVQQRSSNSNFSSPYESHFFCILWSARM